MVYSKCWINGRLGICEEVSIVRCVGGLGPEPALRLEVYISDWDAIIRQYRTMQSKQDVDNIQIAASRLYPGPVPNVSFPVPNGEPALGSSGYSDITLSIAAPRAPAPSGDGVAFAFSHKEMSSVGKSRGVNSVPELE